MNVALLKSVVARHILIIGIFIILEVLFLISSGWAGSLKYVPLTYLFEVAYFYFLGEYVFALKPADFTSRLKKIFLIVGAVVLLTAIKISIVVLPLQDQAARILLLHTPHLYSNMIYRSWFVLCYAGVYWLGRDRVEKAQELKLKELEFENKKVLLENAKLHARINPHTQLNVFNRLYGFYRPLSEPAANIMLAFSDLTRYALREPEEDGKVPVVMEFENLKTFIRLNHLCSDTPLNLNVNIPELTKETSLCIPPMLLLPLVENVFKHGLLRDPDHPAEIMINLEGHKLTSVTKNRKLPERDLPSYNIGLDNVKKRLQNFYPNNWTLDILNTGSEFNLKLQIQL